MSSVSLLRKAIKRAPTEPHENVLDEARNLNKKNNRARRLEICRRLQQVVIEHANQLPRLLRVSVDKKQPHFVESPRRS